MHGVELGGLKGEGARAEWTGPVAKAEHDRREAEFAKEFGFIGESLEFNAPWTSLGQAPTEKNVIDTLHTGTA